MINIPSQQTKKWLTSFRGDFWGNLVNMLNLDLFSSQGKAKAGTKMYPQTVQADQADITPPADFETAQISDGADHPTKVWAVGDNKKIYRGENTDAFELDTSTGFSPSENTGDGSDLVTVPDDSGDPIEVIEANVGTGDGVFSIVGSGNQTKWGQSFTKVDGPFLKLSLYLRTFGSPTDTLTIGIYTDLAGVPDTLLTSIDVDPTTALTPTFTQYEYLAEDFSDPTVSFELDSTYWIVLSRATPNASNYVQGMFVIGGPTDDDPPDDPYENGFLSNFDGTDWSPNTDAPLRKRSFTYQGNDTFVVPAGVTSILVEMWGAGGGGSQGVGGGGGGEYARKTLTVVPGASKAIVVGASAVDTDGGDSTFNGTDVVAKGGKSGTNGGNGGTGGTGDVTWAGGDGFLGAADAAGGSAAGDSAPGGDATDANQVSPGAVNGGIGGGDWMATNFNEGRMIGGGGNSSAANEWTGGRGEVRVTFNLPAVADSAYISDRLYNRSVGNGNVTLQVPATTVPGDLLIAVIGWDGTDVPTLDGWTVLEETTGGGAITQTIYWKKSTGDDTPTFAAVSGLSYIVLRIQNGGTPQASQTGGNGASPTSPTISGLINGKYLHINTVTLNTAAPVDIFGSSPGFPIIEPSGFSGVGNREPHTAISETLFTGTTAGGSWSSTSSDYVAGTIIVPFDDSRNFEDMTFTLEVEFPEATERLYVTTTKDVRVLSEEDTVWTSLWQGVYQQDPLDDNFPHPLVLLEAGGVLFVGDGNKLHSMSANGNSAADVNPNRLIFPASHYINWIIITKSAVFIGLANRIDDLLPSYICYYEPFTEVTRIFNIEEGTTVGWEQDENCFIIDKKGQIRYYNGTEFAFADNFPPFYFNQLMNLPHRNGIKEYGKVTYFLWMGQYPYGAGIWAWDDGRLYHQFGFVFDREELNSFAAVDAPADTPWRALYKAVNGWVAGASALDGDGLAIKGIFTEYTNDDITVEPNNRTHFQTVKFISKEIDSIWQRVFAKIEDRPAGIVEGSVILKQRSMNSPIGEGYNATAFDGSWTDDVNFTCDDAAFVQAVDDGLIVVGDEVIVRSGMGSGMLAHITAIAGTTTKTVTIDSGLTAITTGDFTFSVENWRIIAQRGLTGNQLGKQWLQVKVEVRDFVEVVELQVGSKINRTNEE